MTKPSMAMTMASGSVSTHVRAIFPNSDQSAGKGQMNLTLRIDRKFVIHLTV